MKRSVIVATAALGLLFGISTLPALHFPISFVSTAQAASGDQAVAAAVRGNFSEAQAIAGMTGDPVAMKIVELLYLKENSREAGFERITRFLDANPHWPLSETLNKFAEAALYDNGADANVVRQHFDNRRPKTTKGMLALARAHFQSGNNAKGQAWIEHAWMQDDIDQALEQRVMREFGSVLSADAHRARMHALIFAQQPGAAIRNSKRLSGDDQRAAKVAQALLRGVAGSDKQYRTLSARQQAVPAMKYALARLYRKQKRYDAARNVLANVDEKLPTADAEAMWTERRIIARRSVGIYQQANWRMAYRIASQHGLTSGESAVEAEFVSGWIALRYLKDADRAMAHFSKLAQLAPSRTEKSRAAYWIGRTHLASGDKAKARASFKTASNYSTLYYGQLAREYIGLADEPEHITSGDFSGSAKQRVDGDELIRAFRMMQRVDGDRHLYMFLPAIAKRFDSVEELNAAASIMHDAGGTTMALKFAKVAGQNGKDIDSWAYPLRGLPEWKQIGKPVEKSLVFGLSRQESEFNPRAGSQVGAQGLMQLMPGTARIVARQYRLPYAPAKLKGDPAYNVKLGAAHLADLVEDFNGSYILTLVAYNAGPGRATEWVEAYGDPRGGQVDPVDWVESIPFQETRQYVQKVMQNLHIYRSRLAPQTVRAMSVDLKRGTPRDITVASTEAAAPRASEDSCTGKSIASLISGC